MAAPWDRDSWRESRFVKVKIPREDLETMCLGVS